VRDLDLVHRYLVRLRQEKLQQGHAKALDPNATVTDIRVTAFEAELVSRIHEAMKVLTKDPAKFIEEFLK